jgi:hypothetical protein
MSAVADLIAEAAAAGVTFDIKPGGQIGLKAKCRPSDELVARIRAHKLEIAAELAAGWGKDDWRGEYNERAAIFEFDGKHTRAEAERMAWHVVASRWYREHGKRVSANLCAGCGKPLSGAPHVLLLPHGERAHSADGYPCILAYGRRWKSAAAKVLSAFGIPSPEATGSDA